MVGKALVWATDESRLARLRAAGSSHGRASGDGCRAPETTTRGPADSRTYFQNGGRESHLEVDDGDVVNTYLLVLSKSFNQVTVFFNHKISSPR